MTLGTPRFAARWRPSGLPSVAARRAVNGLKIPHSTRRLAMKELDVRGLRDEFNRAVDSVRLTVLLSPT